MHTRVASLLLLPLLALAAACATGTQAATTGPVPDASGVYDVADVEVKPRLLNVAEVRQHIETSYPPLLRDAGVGGQVELRFVIGPDGVPADVAVTTVTHEGFREGAVTAARLMRFAPGRVGGRAVPTRVTFPIVYQVEPA